MATELGKAYVQIVPSAQGISGSITKAMGGEVPAAGEQAGQSFGSKLVGTMGKVMAAAGIGKLISSAITEGGNLEQSLGGVETLFKDNADKVKEYATQAYKTAGVSANEYMENVTSFSASLLQSLGGDTDKAADVANMAMIDMSDNANKMGTDMRDIQNAYQGFAKQNYTMLDNLKLGYGGTKSEMERLLADAQKLSGVEYDIDNLSDVYEAIHVIQEEIGITGTTALEAEETIQGSLGQLKASFTNLLGALALGGDIIEPLKALGESILTFFKNLAPMIIDIITQIPEALVQILETLGPELITLGMNMLTEIVNGISQGLPELLPRLVEVVAEMVIAFIDAAPQLIDAGLDLIVNLAEGLIQAIPVLIEKIPEIITKLIDAILQSIPEIVQAGIKLLSALVQNLPEIIQAIVKAIPEIIKGIVTAITENLPEIIKAGIELLTALIEDLPTIIKTIVQALPEIITGIVQALVESAPEIISAGVELLSSLVENLPEIISNIVAAIPEIITGIVGAFKDGIGQMVEIGGQLLEGLWEGIKGASGWLWDNVSGWASGLWSDVKGFFGIESPSRLFAWAGEMNMLGFAYGMEDNLNVVSDAMDKVEQEANRTLASELDFTVAGNFSGINGAIGSGFNNGSLDVQNEETNGLLRNLLATLNEKQFGGDVVLDSGELVGALTTPLDESLTMKKQHEQFGGGSLVPVF